MTQDYSRYTRSDQAVWQHLFNRQVALLQDKACLEFLNCLEEMKNVLHGEAIPHFHAMNVVLRQKTGFEIAVVDGLIPVEEFFGLLSKGQFPSSIWLRQPDQLDYLAEPDMFHDIFGHIPLLINPSYAHFMRSFGAMGVSYMDQPNIIKQLQRLYWFTIEFGMLQSGAGPRIYGAGILSSFQESSHVFKPEIRYHAYDIEHMMRTDFDYTDIQKDYFVIDHFDQLYDALQNIGVLVS